MKNNNGKIKIPKHLDRKLLVSFRFKFISRLIRDMGTVWPKKIFQGGLVTACAVLLIVGVTSFQAPSVRYTEAAVSFAYAEAELQNEMIKHQEILYREGADKVSFTQSLEEFDPAHAVSRSEVIERWQHGNHSLAIIIHGITETLPEVHLNFELDDYIHVFRYQSGDCPEHMSLVTGMKDCLSEES